MAALLLTRAFRAIVLLAGVTAAVVLAYESLRLAQAQRVNDGLARVAQTPGQVTAGMNHPLLWIAVARHPVQADGVAHSAALFKQAADASRGEVREAALYDLGNLYLREALRLQAEGADAAALPLFELAKENYRLALFEFPDLWDAKFNLELALRAAPDVDPDEQGASPILTGERAVTTMRAFTLGLP